MSRKKYMFDLKFSDVVPKMLKIARLKTQRELAEFLDIEPSSLTKPKQKDRLQLNQAAHFAIKTNTSLDELLGLKIKVENPTVSADKVDGAKMQIGRPEDEFIFVPHWKDPGGISAFGKVLMEIGQRWIAEHFAENKNDLMAWTMNSDNMKGPHEDSIQKNALILIDKRKTAIDGSGVYALMANGKIIVRRVLENADGSVDLVSDNPAYQNRGPLRSQNLISGELGVLGRVVFVGRAI
jgi:hypothetical protein